MRLRFWMLFWSVLAAPFAAHAQVSDAGRKEVGRELGSVLAWRLMPEIIEQHCRPADPAGAAGRQKALEGWLAKNAALIQSVDERVAEVAPLAYAAAGNGDATKAVRTQVGTLVRQSLFAGKSAQEITDICKAEADPASPRWNNNGMPHVSLALAALYDWQIAHAAKAAP